MMMSRPRFTQRFDLFSDDGLARAISAIDYEGGKETTRRSSFLPDPNARTDAGIEAATAKVVAALGAELFHNIDRCRISLCSGQFVILRWVRWPVRPDLRRLGCGRSTGKEMRLTS
jgi:hypothetical protein